ncbi:MAG TPA: SMP-30/gluconolactonase/LRE family protein [Candidatus Acidoferrales bacterium]|nr:SMP-30/gluconolactonase/LRE family protein [Candidatus Acidoferrales bacterium]
MIRLLPAVLALSIALFAQEFTDLKFDRLSQGYRFTEGPAWCKDGYLIFSDTPSDRLLKWTPGSPVEVLRSDAHGPAGNAFDAQGRLYTCETRTRRVTRTDKSGKIGVLAERWEGKRLNAPNGIVVAKNGSVYFTDPAFGEQSDHRELDFYGVYHIPPKGAMELVAKFTGRPHGITFSPNGRILYVADADAKNVRAFDLDKNGEASNDRVLVPKTLGIPTGIAVDDKGNLWVAGGNIGIYNPEGKRLHTIEMHDPVSACAFGEADMKSLFLTVRGVVMRARHGGD